MGDTLHYNAWRTVGAALLLVPAMLPAQGRIARSATLLGQPAAEARSIGTVPAGASVRVGAPRGAWVAITVEGWLDAAVLGPKADTFPRSAGTEGARVRAAAARTAAVVATLKKGAGVQVLGRQGSFFKVRRMAWVRAEALGGADPAGRGPARSGSPDATTAAPPARGGTGSGVRAVPNGAAQGSPTLMPDATPSTAQPVPDGALKAGARGADLRVAPDGRPLAALKAGAVATPVARDRGWVRVRVEGWVRERDLEPADSAARGVQSAADLRADPEGSKGRVVRWTVELLGVQTADGLRRDLADGEPYALARGPDGEDALLYLALPPSLVAQVKALPPMSRLLVTARVRIGRSEPTGVPVLDLMTVGRP
jgi:hypothetical protein